MTNKTLQMAYWLCPKCKSKNDTIIGERKVSCYRCGYTYDEDVPKFWQTRMFEITEDDAFQFDMTGDEFAFF